jgi:hypothetical protein
LTDRMFVRDEKQLNVGFTAARAALAGLARSRWLKDASEGAYDAGMAGLARYVAPGSAVGTCKLLTVHSRALAARHDSAGLAVRWDAAGSGGLLFPAFDADITLGPAGEHATMLAVTGVYRPPPGRPGDGLDRAVVDHLAQTTVRVFLDRVTDAITAPARERDRRTGGGGDSWAPAAERRRTPHPEA